MIAQNFGDFPKKKHYGKAPAYPERFAIPLHAGIDAHLVAPVAWRVPPTKNSSKKVA
jgi:hypothetical protein